MKLGRCSKALVVAMTTAMLATSSAWPLMAIAQTTRGIMMYEDVKTGAFYSKPGRGRVAVGRLILGAEEAPPPSAPVPEQVQKEVKKHDDELRAEFLANQSTLLQKNAELSKQVAEIKPAWADYTDNFKNKVRFGTLIYGDYRLYSHTTFQPQELTQINNPGIGNNWYNSFDISRAYINLFFTPT